MEFKSLTNIESSFKRIRLMLVVFVCAVHLSLAMRCGTPTASLRNNGKKSMCWTVVSHLCSLSHKI